MKGTEVMATSAPNVRLGGNAVAGFRSLIPNRNRQAWSWRNGATAGFFRDQDTGGGVFFSLSRKIPGES